MARRPYRRRAGILRLLEQSDSVTVADLVEQLGVSEATVRRDLVRLDQEGVLRRTHGGARRIVLRGAATPFFARSAVNHDAKVRIADAAAGMVTSGESVILDSGTTCLEVARQLRVSDVRVMPLSLRSAAVLGELRAILLCDESKWGRTTFGWAADASQLTTIITDHTPTDAERAEAHQHGVEVITV